MTSLSQKTAEKLAEAQFNNPWKFLIFSLILTVLTGIYAKGLVFDSSYEALLPKGADEIKNVDNIRAKTGGTRQLVIAIRGGNSDDRLKFGKKIEPALRKLKHIKAVDLEFPIEFFKKRGMWLLDIPTLDKLIPALKNAINIAKSQANPLALHLDEDEEKKELNDAWKKVEHIIKKSNKNAPFDGVLTSKDNKYTFIIVVPSIKFTDMKKGQALLKSIKDTVNSANPQKMNVTVKYAGALEVLEEQHHIMQSDMIKASILAMIFGILIVAGFTRRILSPLIISAALLMGIVWTFAMARLLVGHVNIITGFLAAVLIGLGIDFGIHLFVRYQQELKIEGATLKQVFVRFISGTLPPALTAAATTAGVFLTFAIAEFRGFSEFGMIAAVGVIFTLASSFLVLPPLLLLIYKDKLLHNQTDKLQKTQQVSRFPMPLAVTVIAATSALFIAGIFGLQHIKFKNDFRELRGYSKATVFTDYVNKNLGVGFNPAVFIANSVKDAAVIKQTLQKSIESDAGKNLDAQIGSVMSVTDLLPSDIDSHKERIEKLKDILLSRSLNKALQKDTPDAKKLKDAREMVTALPWTIQDVPYIFRRRFITLDKQQPQYLVFAWSLKPHDADYKAAAWEKTLNNIKKSLKQKNIKVEMGDETLIVSWIYRMVKKDAAPLFFISIFVVIVFLIIDFRNIKDLILLLTSLTGGMFAFIAIAYFAGININMFNMIVFPSVIGIGIDNAVHILHRYKHEGRGSIVFVLKNTGTAALLASTTTAVGFGSSIIAHNLGLKSMGIMAIIGISSTFFAAVLFLPAILTIVEKIKSTKQ